MNFLKRSAACFLLVDSYNKERNLAFYERNGFNYLFSSEEQEREFRGLKSDRPLNSRLMYFDLIGAEMLKIHIRNKIVTKTFGSL